MNDSDNTELNRGKSQLELDREQVQDDMMEHRLSKENELRRKRGLPEIPYYLKDLRSPEEIKANKEFRLKCLEEAQRKAEQYMIARYLKRKKKELENEQ